MKRPILAALAAATLLAAAAPGAAQQRQRAAEPRQQYGEEDPIVLDPAKAYILYRTPARISYRFVREVTEPEQAEWVEARTAALAREHDRYERRLRRWQSDRELCSGSGSRSGTCAATSERPVEPTDATFAFPPPEADNFVENAYRPRLANAEEWSTWLIAVEPGTYALYGAVTTLPNGSVAGQCFCMGSVRFEANAGQVTDMGEIQVVPADQQGEVTATTFRLGHYATVTPPGPSLRTPPQLSRVTVVPAELRAADKLPNYFGITITRLAPVPGILAYQRDLVIDGRTGLPVDRATAPATRLR